MFQEIFRSSVCEPIASNATPPRKSFGWFTSIVGLFLCCSCAPKEAFTDTACTAFQPITYSASGDTEATKSQIRQHNAAWQALCK